MAKKATEPAPVAKTSKELETLQKILTMLKQGDVNRQAVARPLRLVEYEALGQRSRRTTWMNPFLASDRPQAMESQRNPKWPG